MTTATELYPAPWTLEQHIQWPYSYTITDKASRLVISVPLMAVASNDTLESANARPENAGLHEAVRLFAAAKGMFDSLTEMAEAAGGGKFYDDYDEACSRIGRAMVAIMRATPPIAATREQDRGVFPPVARTRGETMDQNPAPWRIGVPTDHGTFNCNCIYDANGESVASVYGIPLHTTLEQVMEDKSPWCDEYRKGIALAQRIVNAVNSAERAKP